MQAKTVTKKYNTSTFKVATAAIFAALVAVVTLTFVIPIPILNGGYFNLGDALIYCAALLFGPFVGLIAGAGASIADILIAPHYASVTLVIKTTEGFLVGYLIKRLKIKNLTLRASIAILIGGFEMVTGYFLFETYMLGYHAAVWGILVNLSQMLVGLIIAIPVMHAVLRVFPQLKMYL
jgi:uncharacterized membrane protein